MRVLFREPVNQPLRLIEVENDVESIQKLIGGYFAVIKIREDICCIFDEDGMLKMLPTNYYIDEYGWIVGNVLFCSFEESELTSLNDEQIKFIKDYIGFPVE